MYLLDTHVLIWHVEGNTRRIGRRTARLLERWAAQDDVRISPLTVFELACLYAAGRLQLSRSLEQWTTAAIESAGARLAPLTTEAAADAGTMSSVLVPDPVDRLLIATARQADATLVTADARILSYADDARNVAVHDARR